MCHHHRRLALHLVAVIIGLGALLGLASDLTTVA